MWVLKLGGSLLETGELPETLKQLSEHGAGQVVIVPGGGVFADQVRLLDKELKLDDLTAHRLALRAMEEFGELLITMNSCLHAAESLEAINYWLDQDQIPVWFPYKMTFDNPAIKASWDITSDSLSFWLASQLECQNLVLLKPAEPQENNYSAAYLSNSGFIDGAFGDMLVDTFVKPWWLYYKYLSSFLDLLENKNPESTHLKPITT